MAYPFTVSSKVEVLRNDGAYYPATILPSQSSSTSKIYVQYLTLTLITTRTLNHSPDSLYSRDPVVPEPILSEYVDGDMVRPVPPSDGNRCFRIGDNVDAYDDGAWRRGTVEDILENSRYLVGFFGREGCFECDQWNLRAHKDWDAVNGWNNSRSVARPQRDKEQFNMPKQSLKRAMKPVRVRFKVACRKNKSSVRFTKGSEVEVSSDEKGYEDAWYTAVIADYLGNDKYLVEYLTLKTEDEVAPLREEAMVQFIRPFPPPLETVCFQRLDKVDAWYNEGWWVGVISKTVRRWQYYVYFATTKEEILFDKAELRLHQDWIDGNWIAPNKVDLGLKKLNEKRTEANQKTSKPKFYKGMKVEVKSDEDGYRGSWYTAVIVDILGPHKFLVEYETLKTEDEKQNLREQAKTSELRPCPPVVQHAYRFRQLEMVDAWYNEGWWVGHISDVLEDMRYRVFFETSNEEIEFDHDGLRPHQEWNGCKWAVASRYEIFSE